MFVMEKYTTVFLILSVAVNLVFCSFGRAPSIHTSLPQYHILHNNWMPFLGHSSSGGGIGHNTVKVTSNVKNAVVIGNTANVDTHIGVQNNAAPPTANSVTSFADSLPGNVMPSSHFSSTKNIANQDGSGVFGSTASRFLSGLGVDSSSGVRHIGLNPRSQTPSQHSNNFVHSAIAQIPPSGSLPSLASVLLPQQMDLSSSTNAIAKSLAMSFSHQPAMQRTLTIPSSSGKNNKRHRRHHVTLPVSQLKGEGLSMINSLTKTNEINSILMKLPSSGNSSAEGRKIEVIFLPLEHANSEMNINNIKNDISIRNSTTVTQNKNHPQQDNTTVPLREAVSAGTSVTKNTAATKNNVKQTFVFASTANIMSPVKTQHNAPVTTTNNHHHGTKSSGGQPDVHHGGEPLNHPGTSQVDSNAFISQFHSFLQSLAKPQTHQPASGHNTQTNNAANQPISNHNTQLQVTSNNSASSTDPGKETPQIHVAVVNQQSQSQAPSKYEQKNSTEHSAPHPVAPQVNVAVISQQSQSRGATGGAKNWNSLTSTSEAQQPTSGHNTQMNHAIVNQQSGHNPGQSDLHAVSSHHGTSHHTRTNMAVVDHQGLPPIILDNSVNVRPHSGQTGHNTQTNHAVISQHNNPQGNSGSPSSPTSVSHQGHFAEKVNLAVVNQPQGSNIGHKSSAFGHTSGAFRHTSGAFGHSQPQTSEVQMNSAVVNQQTHTGGAFGNTAVQGNPFGSSNNFQEGRAQTNTAIVSQQNQDNPMLRRTSTFSNTGTLPNEQVNTATINQANASPNHHESGHNVGVVSQQGTEANSINLAVVDQSNTQPVAVIHGSPAVQGVSNRGMSGPHQPLINNPRTNNIRKSSQSFGQNTNNHIQPSVDAGFMSSFHRASPNQQFARDPASNTQSTRGHSSQPTTQDQQGQQSRIQEQHNIPSTQRQHEQPGTLGEHSQPSTLLQNWQPGTKEQHGQQNIQRQHGQGALGQHGQPEVQGQHGQAGTQGHHGQPRANGQFSQPSTQVHHEQPGTQGQFEQSGAHGQQGQLGKQGQLIIQEKHGQPRTHNQPNAQGQHKKPGTHGQHSQRNTQGQHKQPGTHGQHSQPNTQGQHVQPGTQGQHSHPNTQGQNWQPGTQGQHRQPNTQGQHVQPGTQGQHSHPNTQGQHWQPGTQGQHSQPNTQVQHWQPGTQGQHSQPNAQGQHVQPGSHGQHSRPNTQVHHVQPGSQGQHSHPNAQGQHVQPGTQGQHSQPNTQGQHWQPGTQGQHSQPNTQGQHVQPGTQGQHSQPNTQGEHVQPGSQGQHRKPGPHGQHGQPNAQGQHVQPGSQGQHSQPNTQGQHWQPGTQGQHSQPNTQGQHWQPGTQGQHSQPNTQGQHVQPGTQGQHSQPNTQGQNWQPGTQGQHSQPNTQGQHWQPGTQGQHSQPNAQGQHVQPGSHGQHSLPNTQGQNWQSGSHGQHSQPNTQGQHVQPGSHGQSSQPNTQGQNWQPGSHGQHSQPNTQGQNWQPGTQGQHSQPNTQGQNWQPVTQGQHSQPNTQGQKWQPGTQGQHSKPSTQGQNRQPGTQGQHSQPSTQGQHVQPGSQGQHSQLNTQGQHVQPGSQGQHSHPNTQGQNWQPGTQGQHSQPNTQGMNWQPGTQGQYSQRNIQGQHWQPGTQGQHSQPNTQGQHVQPGSQRQHSQPNTQGQNWQPGTQGQHSQPNTQGQNWQPGTQGQQSQPNTQGQNWQPGTQGQHSQPNTQGQHVQQGTQGQHSQPNTQGQNWQPGTQGQHSQPNTQGQHVQPRSQGQHWQPDTQGQHGQSGTQGQHWQLGTQRQHGQTGTQGQHGQPGAQGQHGQPGTQGHHGQPRAQGQHGQLGTQGQQGQIETQGQQGPLGTQGQQGQPGAQGQHGQLGQQGQQGQPGTQGEPGTQGQHGQLGTQGQQGQPGTQRHHGQPGTQGQHGQQTHFHQSHSNTPERNSSKPKAHGTHQQAVPRAAQPLIHRNGALSGQSSLNPAQLPSVLDPWNLQNLNELRQQGGNTIFIVNQFVDPRHNKLSSKQHPAKQSGTLSSQSKNNKQFNSSGISGQRQPLLNRMQAQGNGLQPKTSQLFKTPSTAVLSPSHARQPHANQPHLNKAQSTIKNSGLKQMTRASVHLPRSTGNREKLMTDQPNTSVVGIHQHHAQATQQQTPAVNTGFSLPSASSTGSLTGPRASASAQKEILGGRSPPLDPLPRREFNNASNKLLIQPSKGIGPTEIGSLQNQKSSGHNNKGHSTNHVVNGQGKQVNQLNNTKQSSTQVPRVTSTTVATPILSHLGWVEPSSNIHPNSDWKVILDSALAQSGSQNVTKPDQGQTHTQIQIVAHIGAGFGQNSSHNLLSTDQKTVNVFNVPRRGNEHNAGGIYPFDKSISNHFVEYIHPADRSASNGVSNTTIVVNTGSHGNRSRNKEPGTLPAQQSLHQNTADKTTVTIRKGGNSNSVSFNIVTVSQGNNKIPANKLRTSSDHFQPIGNFVSFRPNNKIRNGNSGNRGVRERNGINQNNAIERRATSSTPPPRVLELFREQVRLANQHPPYTIDVATSSAKDVHRHRLQEIVPLHKTNG